jgi:hypothetical protein
MMVFNNGGSSYRVGYFLASKSTDTTLIAFTEFHVKLERETRKQLIRLWVDMGNEFFNNKWKEYTAKHGIAVEFSMPYTHSQNGVAERGMRTIIERTRCLLADSSLPRHSGLMPPRTASTQATSSPLPITLDVYLLNGGQVNIKMFRICGLSAALHTPRYQRR